MSDLPDDLRRWVESNHLDPNDVWAASISVHGYPPTWCHTADESAAIRRAINTQPQSRKD